MTTDHDATCEGLLQWATGRLAAGAFGGGTPRLDAELLLAHVTGHSRTRFRAWPEAAVPPEQVRAFEALLAQREAGRPIAHLLGEQEFWSLPLQVTDATLIPRPDTECLVEAALTLSLPATARVLDLGTGTGAIALALASEQPGWQVTACDRVPAAVELARDNARRLGLAVSVYASDWFAGLPDTRFDLIVANPPYIREDDRHLAEGDVRFEPVSALVAGPDGLADLRRIVAEAPDWLSPGGWLLLEHGYDQGAEVRTMMQQRGFDTVETRPDYGRRDRMTLGRWLTGPAVIEDSDHAQ